GHGGGVAADRLRIAARRVHLAGRRALPGLRGAPLALGLVGDMSTLAARALTCRRGTRTVLESIDVAFVADQVTAIVGPNGSGKTTLLRHLAGLDSPAAGRVELDGIPIGGLGAGVRARRIAYLPQ